MGIFWEAEYSINDADYQVHDYRFFMIATTTSRRLETKKLAYRNLKCVKHTIRNTENATFNLHSLVDHIGFSVSVVSYSTAQCISTTSPRSIIIYMWLCGHNIVLVRHLKGFETPRREYSIMEVEFGENYYCNNAILPRSEVCRMGSHILRQHTSRIMLLFITFVPNLTLYGTWFCGVDK